MMRIYLKEFQDSVNCTSLLFTSKESFVRVSHEFASGNVYGFASDFGCGGWGLVTCIGGRCVQPCGNVFLNGQIVACDTLAKHSLFISENLYNGLNSMEDYLTPKKCIERALQISQLPYTSDEIRNIFYLSGSEERFERDLQYVGIEIWRISMAIGFAYGKEIFCFPWLNERDLNYFEVMYKQNIIHFLKEQGKIVLVPSSQKKFLLKSCDEVLVFDKDKITIK